MAGKVSQVTKLADELAVAIAERALGRGPKPQELPGEDGQDTMGMETMFQALARLTSWVAVKNRIEDDEPAGDFFSAARGKLSRKGGGRGSGGARPAIEADRDGGEPEPAAGSDIGSTGTNGAASASPGGSGAFSDTIGAHLSNGIADPV